MWRSFGKVATMAVAVTRMEPAAGRMLLPVRFASMGKKVPEMRPPYYARPFGAKSPDASQTLFEDPDKKQSKLGFDWIDKEAQTLISQAYSRQLEYQSDGRSFPPALGVKDLENLVPPNLHRKPEDFTSKVAYTVMRTLRVFTNAFFGDRYLHHATLLETVAAVPGIVGGAHRHLRSLRRMQRDHTWISHLHEEAHNERMHLLIWMKLCKPSFVERGLVVFAQLAYTSVYTAFYFISPKFAHRMVGYLEEEAVSAYTEFLHHIDAGKTPNVPAPEIAREYYRLPDDAKLRDVVLHVRADEIMHQMVNHHLADKYKHNDLDTKPAAMGPEH